MQTNHLIAEHGMKDLLRPAEVILITLLIALALGTWSTMESLIAEALLKLEPREDQTQLDHQVPRLQSEAKAVEDGLAAVRAKVLELELEKARQSGVRSNLLHAYPGLRALGFTESDEPGPGGDIAGSISLETLQAYLQAQTELKAARFLTEQLESDLSRQIARKVELAKKPGAMTKGSSEVLRVESELASCQEQLLAVQKKLAETRLEVPRYESRLEAMAVSEPRLRAVAPSPLLLQGLSSQALQSLATNLQGALLGQLEGLRGELRRREQALTQEKSELIKAQRAATQDLNQRRLWWTFMRSGLSFLASLLVVASSLGVVFLAPKLFPALQVSPDVLRLGESILIAGLTILILFFYQGFQILGAALGATALLLLLIPIAVSKAGREREGASKHQGTDRGEGAAPSEERKR
jgi:hypothetical protein